MASFTAGPSSRAAEPSRSTETVGDRMGQWLRRLESPMASYYGLVIITVALVTIGLVMVLSASAIISYKKTESPYTIFLRQAQFAAVGSIALIVASRLPLAFWKRTAPLVMLAAIAFQAAVFTPLGLEDKGNRNWLAFGPITMQPSELSKIGLAVFGAVILGRKYRLLHRFGHVLVPYLVPVAALSIGLVLYGNDLGTVLVLMGIVGGVLFAAGVDWRYFALALVGGGGLAGLMVAISPNRLDRFAVWLGRDTDIHGMARQPTYGRYALADGGWWGVGLGQSREKWQYLAEPHNDFIFAIIGEELGLPGTLVILALFAALALVCYRIVRRADDLFVRLATAGVMAWIITQAVINIGAVIGLLPVIGVPLPLVSAGGSSLVTTMGALGMLMSFARQEPGCAEAFAARPPFHRRALAAIRPARRHT
ncbi:MAG: putative lipid II flippase FtsW [Micrococcales bacterium]|nr:putative lipid II flippase FtsW [Micrococcales bacterium]